MHLALFREFSHSYYVNPISHNISSITNTTTTNNNNNNNNTNSNNNINDNNSATLSVTLSETLSDIIFDEDKNRHIPQVIYSIINIL